MKTTIAMLTLVLGSAFGLTSAFARDALPQATQQVLRLKDGATLYVFKDGKMAREDRFGRASYLKSGEILELADGSKVTATSNEVARLDGLLNDGHRN